MGSVSPLIEEIEPVIRGIDGREDPLATSIFVLVLVVAVLESVPCPSAWNGTTALEESRLGAWHRDPATFVAALLRPKPALNRRLPGTTQRVEAHRQNPNQ
jgi:hypothetical protein